MRAHAHSLGPVVAGYITRFALPINLLIIGSQINHSDALKVRARRAGNCGFLAIALPCNCVAVGIRVSVPFSASW